MADPSYIPVAAYTLALPPGADIAAIGSELFRRVWRTTLDWPGFALLVPSAPVTSHVLRRMMLDVVDVFSREAVAKGLPGFVPERLGRFDQQVTTKFHRDGGPDRSLLILGYEPTPVRSRFFAADAPAAARAAGVGVAAFLAAHNPMFPPGAARLAPFVTELALPPDTAFIVVLNNSLLPDGGSGPVPLGVLHKGEIPHPDPAARRVINSFGAMPEGDAPGRWKTPAEVEHFLRRDDLD